MAWQHLSVEARDLLVFRKYHNGEDVGVLAQETGIAVTTLDRYLRLWKADRGVIQTREIQTPHITPAPSIPPDCPPEGELFQVIRKAGTISLEELSRKYDRSKDTVQVWIKDLRSKGYVIQETAREQVTYDPQAITHQVQPLPSTLADQAGQVLRFAALADSHSGSLHAQPTNLRRFLDIAYEQYEVRHVFVPGDLSAGVNGYRGQDQDLIPPLRASGRNPSRVTVAQIDLMDHYHPAYPGLHYFLLGGNHDYWHVVNSGIDAVGQLCARRPDMHNLGYDVADIPLTDRVDLRLYHPTGGVPYAISYRLQKTIESAAFDELERAILEAENPRMRILLAGHLHIEVKFQRGPMLAAHVGCFEGQSNYLKRKGLYPSIGGAIFRLWLSDGGLIQRCEYTFIPFTEIPDDWANYPVSPSDDVVMDPDRLQVLFSAQVEDPDSDNRHP